MKHYYSGPKVLPSPGGLPPALQLAHLRGNPGTHHDGALGCGALKTKEQKEKG